MSAFGWHETGWQSWLPQGELWDLPDDPPRNINPFFTPIADMTTLELEWMCADIRYGEWLDQVARCHTYDEGDGHQGRLGLLHERLIEAEAELAQRPDRVIAVP